MKNRNKYFAIVSDNINWDVITVIAAPTKAAATRQFQTRGFEETTEVYDLGGHGAKGSVHSTFLYGPYASETDAWELK